MSFVDWGDSSDVVETCSSFRHRIREAWSTVEIE